MVNILFNIVLILQDIMPDITLLHRNVHTPGRRGNVNRSLDNTEPSSTEWHTRYRPVSIKIIHSTNLMLHIVLPPFSLKCFLFSGV